MQRPIHHGASSSIFANAKALRKEMTAAEVRLWKHLRNRRFKGHKFRRQHPLKSFIADFYCHKARLVIEVDGEIHLQPDIAKNDVGRTEAIEDVGLRVIRFTNKEVLERIDWVLETIVENLNRTP